jgi:AAA domain
MTVNFRPAVRENVNLLIGLAGASGSGKTYSAMRLASGIAQGKKFCVIDTESGRASHYADQFQFDVGELRPPFTPQAYAEAIKAAVAAGYGVIVVDSMSHEYAGEGGVLDMQEAEFERMGSREGAKVASWIKPKTEHKRMMQELLQVRAHLILCFRAEPKIEIIKEDGKTKIVPKQSLIGLDGWIPVTEKNVPFELTVSMLMTADAPGIPKPIKLQQQHRALFPLDKPITEDSGRLIAEWAAGGKAKADTGTNATQSVVVEAASAASSPTYITLQQASELQNLCHFKNVEVDALKKKAGVEALNRIPADQFDRCKTWVNAH